MNTSSGPPAARTSRKRVLNAFTTWVLAGAALATICATEVPSGVASPVALGLKGFVMSTTILSANASPYSLTTGTALSNSTARMTMSPAGAAPHVPAVAPSPSARARAAALAASRPMTSTALPPLRARAPMALAMLPEPMMLMLLMVCSLSPTGSRCVNAGARLGKQIWVLNLPDSPAGRKLCTPICTKPVRSAASSASEDSNSVEVGTKRGEFRANAVALARVGGQRQPQFGGAQSAGEIAAPPEGRHQVVEHPHRRLVRRPWAHELCGHARGDLHAAAERVQQQRLGRAEVPDDVVAGQPDAGEGHAGPPRRLDIDGRHQDRQAAPALQHAVEHRVLRPVILLGVAGGAVQHGQHMRDGERLRLGCAGRAAQDPGDLLAEPVERGERSG